jgi:hypothetical protein
MKKYIVASLASLLSPLMFWLGGYDFDHRGFEIVGCVWAMIALFLWVMSYPGWRE